MQKISLFSTSKSGSRTIAPEENFPPNPSPNPKANPNPKPNWGAIFFWGNCPGNGKNKILKLNKKQQNKEQINKTKEAKFYQIKKNFKKFKLRQK